MILVDEPRWYERSPTDQHVWCHMVTDGDSFDELHGIAKLIGLKQEWFQGDHYDLVPSKRAMALKYGAVAVSARALVQRRLRKDGTHGVPKLNLKLPEDWMKGRP